MRVRLYERGALQAAEVRKMRREREIHQGGIIYTAAARKGVPALFRSALSFDSPVKKVKIS